MSEDEIELLREEAYGEIFELKNRVQIRERITYE